jgi:hypothetical protein
MSLDDTRPAIYGMTEQSTKLASMASRIGP